MPAAAAVKTTITELPESRLRVEAEVTPEEPVSPRAVPAPPAVKTTITGLPESRVRVEAEVTPEETERSVQRTAAAMGRDLRMPGFRKGKIPPPVVIQRMGREAVVDEAV